MEIIFENERMKFIKEWVNDTPREIDGIRDIPTKTLEKGYFCLECKQRVRADNPFCRCGEDWMDDPKTWYEETFKKRKEYFSLPVLDRQKREDRVTTQKMLEKLGDGFPTAAHYYILNSAVITAPGLYEYKYITVQDATFWLLAKTWESCIGYPETAAALEEITGHNIPVNRKTITMQPGDEALVFRLVFPQGYRPDPAQKGAMGREFILKNSEIGILRRLE